MKKREQVYALALLFLVVSCKGKKEEATADGAIPVKVETVSTTTQQESITMWEQLRKTQVRLLVFQ